MIDISKEELKEKFDEMFPDWANSINEVVDQGKDGEILIKFKEGPSFHFGIKAHDNDSDEIYLIREDQYKKDPSRPFYNDVLAN